MGKTVNYKSNSYFSVFASYTLGNHKILDIVPGFYLLCVVTDRIIPIANVELLKTSLMGSTFLSCFLSFLLFFYHQNKVLSDRI